MSVNNRGKKILLVDDDQGLRTVLAEQLDLYECRRQGRRIDDDQRIGPPRPV